MDIRLNPDDFTESRFANWEFHGLRLLKHDFYCNMWDDRGLIVGIVRINHYDENSPYGIMILCANGDAYNWHINGESFQTIESSIDRVNEILSSDGFNESRLVKCMACGWIGRIDQLRPMSVYESYGDVGCCKCPECGRNDLYDKGLFVSVER